MLSLEGPTLYKSFETEKTAVTTEKIDKNFIGTNSSGAI